MMQRSPIPGNLLTSTASYSTNRTIISTTNTNQRVSGYVVSSGLASPLITPAPVPGPSLAVTSNNLPGTSLQQAEPITREEIKSHFTTAEGIYKKMTVATYSRPNKTAIVNTGTNAVPNCPVRVSFASIPDPGVCNCLDENQKPFCSEKICFNVGRELFVYDYVSIHGTPNLTMPIDKRIYKGTFPTCHDFNQKVATFDSCPLIIGFSAGQVQLIDPLRKELVQSKLFNEERNIEKSSVTCVKWIPDNPKCFMVSYSSGNIYVYNESFQCFEDIPLYQSVKQGDGYAIFTTKTKAQRNPISKLRIGTGTGINEFEFYQNNQSLQLAIVSQDGYLRIFDYQQMELIGLMKSYFGGLLCLAWSPDGKYIATGGEDDLLTVYSVLEKRVICRGQGHKSWISKVAFDPYATALSAAVSSSSIGDALDDTIDGTGNIVYTTASVNKYGCEEPMQVNGCVNPMNLPPPSVINIVSSPTANGLNYSSGSSIPFHGENTNLQKSISNNCVNLIGMDYSQHSTTGYRIGSVGHDTQLLLWDIGDDILTNLPINTTGNKIVGPTTISVGLHSVLNEMNSLTHPEGKEHVKNSSSDVPSLKSTSSTKSKLKKLHKRGFSFGNRISRAVGASTSQQQNGYINGHATDGNDGSNIFGSLICPKLHNVPVIEPFLNKKIAHERLTVLFFREECIVTGCQEGFICTWARPGRLRRHSIGSNKTNTSMAGGVEAYASGGTHV